MPRFKEIDLKRLSLEPFSLIGDAWMLITAGDAQDYNMMTASWGGLGVLWNKPVALCFIRPQRYTFEFAERNDYFSLSFYDEKYRGALMLCGSKSGRDINKTEATNLTPAFDEPAPYFEEADLVFVCKKIHSQFLDPKCFIDTSIEKNYNNGDYHKMYVGKIIKGLKKQ